MSHTRNDESPDEESVFPFIINSLTDDREQTQFCKNLLAKITPCKSEFSEIRIKRQIVEHYLKGKCNLKQQYRIYTIEIITQRTFHGKYVIQTNDIDLEFSKVFTEYIKCIQYQNSQRANSIFTNEVFSIIFSYLSKLEKTEAQSTSPVEASRHTKIRNEIAAFSVFLNTISENLINNDVSKNAKLDLLKFLHGS